MRTKYDIAVLVVDDEPTILEQLVQILRRRVDQVYAAANGQEALELYHRETIDVIVSDVDMPIMDGIALLKAIRAEDEAVPFILSTGLKNLDILTQAIDHGITSFLPKPLDKEKLIKQLHESALKKQALVELQRSQNLLQQYKDAVDASAIVSKTDPKGIITYVNENFCQLSGYTADELLGSPHNIVRHPSMPGQVFAEMWQTLQQKKVWQGVVNNRKKDGSMYTVKSTISPILDDQGNIVEYLGIRDDITEIVMKDREIQNERQKLYQVLDNMESIVVMNRSGQELLFVNARFFEIFPYRNVEEFRREHECICDLFEERDGHLRKYMNGVHWIDYMAEHRDIVHKAVILDKYGVPHTYSVKVKAIWIEDDEQFNVITLNDITELEKIREEIELVSQAKGEFLANMSHEIRTPMNGILGFTKLLEQGTLDEKQRRYVDVIHSSTHTLLGIINDILDFSKLQSGKFELDITHVNPFIEFEKTAMLFMAKAHEQNIIYEVTVDPTLSECIRLDLLRIQQIVSNLIGNAIKFTGEKGRIEFYVRVLDRVDDEMQIRIGVKDSGIGISKEKQEHIFEAFSQADSSTTRQFGGTGLGLSISSHLVSLMGGMLKVESEEGEGSDFFFDITVKVCESENPLKELYAQLSLKLVHEPQDTTPCQEKVIEYLEMLNIPFRKVTGESLSELFEENELYFLFCNSDERILQQLSDANIPTIIACNDVKTAGLAGNVTVISDLLLNVSALYNALLAIGMKLNARKDHSLELGAGEGRSYCGEILVAEDNDVNQILMEEILGDFNLKPLIVNNGQEAVDAALQKHFDLILMDINMPVMGGIEAVQLIKDRGITTPVVALTANAMEGDRERFIEEGFDNYLSKPIMIEDLEQILKLYLKEGGTVRKEELPEAADAVEEAIGKVVDFDLIHRDLPFPKKVLDKLFRVFIDTFGPELEQLNAAIASEAFREIEHTAHKLKGAASNMRITPIQQMCQTIETAAKSHERIDYADLSKKIEATFNVVKIELEEALNG